MDDQALLAACPDFISLGGLLKATPREEAGERTIYFEASNEDVDHQNEIVLQKALAESADYFLRHGNIDISHYSLLGPKHGIPNYMEYEIGKPVAARVDGTRTFVKAQLYRGESAMAKNANLVWDSMTKQKPPKDWFPSIGGAALAKSIRIDPLTKSKVAVIERVRWSNVALDQQPVNRTVPAVSTAPVGVFTKSLGGFVVKALEAGYGTDSAALSGGAAIRKQSLDGAPKNYFEFRESLAEHIRSKQLGDNPSPADLVAHASKTFGLSAGQSAEWVERFMRDMKTGLKKRRS